MTPSLIAANFKLHQNPKETRNYIDQLLELRHASREKISPDIILFPPLTSLESSVVATAKTKISIGAQNASEHLNGAYTGETSMDILKFMGIEWVLLGHSERRTLYHESSELIAKKLKTALDVGLKPILCIGETYTQHQDGESEKAFYEQLKPVIAELDGRDSHDESQPLFIAYEPLWAIGQGRAAGEEDIIAAADSIRKQLTQASKKIKLRLLYGGSVSASNSGKILSLNGIDGVLVGGASLDSLGFSKIIASCP